MFSVRMELMTSQPRPGPLAVGWEEGNVQRDDNQLVLRRVERCVAATGRIGWVGYAPAI